MNINQFYNTDLEISLLGVMLNDSNALDDLIDVKEDIFYNTNNKNLFIAIKTLWQDNIEVTVPNIYGLLKTDIDNVGSISYVTSVQTNYISSTGYKKIAENLEEYRVRREIREITKDIGTMLKNEEKNETILSEISNKIDNINNLNEEDNGDIENPLDELCTILEERSINKGKVTGIETKLKGLDKRINGLNKQQLIIIAGRPAQGKTTLANNIALKIAHQGKHVAIFNLEMSKEQILEKMLSCIAFIKNDDLKLGNLDDEGWIKVAKGQSILSELRKNLKLFDKILDLDKIIAHSKKLKKQNKLDVLIVDYLQLIELNSGKKNMTREQEISTISRRLKLLSKELGITVIALAQLSRAPEQRADHRPILSDLRESGSIEQDADIVMFTYRDEYYNAESEEKGIMEIIISKQRNGSTGTEKIAWIPEYQKVCDLELNNY